MARREGLAELEIALIGMQGERFRRIEELFLAAVELPAPERRDYLRKACGTDTSLASEVEAMLACDNDAVLAAVQEIANGALAAEDPEPASEQLLTPKMIGKYRILDRIAVGGMGIVYRAEQDNPRRQVAVKAVRADVMNPGLIARFQQEKELLGRLTHPGIAHILEAGTFDHGYGQQPFFAMELVDGVDLLSFARQRNLSIEARLRLFIDLCDAIQHAHDEGVIHRDLKPDNILITDAGHCKVLDFGVGRAVGERARAATVLTQAGVMIGTLGYMSPEQLTGDLLEPDTRSDVYSLGMILYEFLSGQQAIPVEGLSMPDVWGKIEHYEPVRLGTHNRALAGDLEAIVAKAIFKEPRHRYASASLLADDIRRYLDDKPIRARPATNLYHLRRFARRHKAAVAGAIATVVALLAGMIATGVQSVRVAEHARLAETNENRARREAGRANLAAANAAIALGDLRQARRRLEQVPTEHRHWEWGHLWSQLDRTEAIHTLPAADDAIPTPGAGLAFGPAGDPLILEVAGQEARVVRMLDGQIEATLDLASPIVAAALSDNGNRIAAVDEDLVVHLHDRATGRGTRVLRPGLRGPLRTMRFHADAQILELGSPHEVALVDVAGAQLRLRHPIPPPRQVRDSTFCAATGRLFVHTGERESTLGYWSNGELLIIDSRSGRVLREGPTRVMPPMLIAPDGLQLACETKSFAALLSTEDLASPASMVVSTIAPGPNAKEIHSAPPTLTCSAFSADGRLLANGGSGQVTVNDAKSGALVRTFFLPRTEPAALQWSPDNSALLLTDTRGAKRLIRCDLHSNPASTLLEGPSGIVQSDSWLAFDGEGRACALSLDRRSLRLHRMSDDVVVASFALPAPATIASLSKGCSYVAAVDTSGVLRVWNVATHEQRSATQLELTETPAALRFRDDAVLLEVSLRHEVLTVDAESGSVQARHPLKATQTYMDAAFSADGAALLVLTAEPLLDIDENDHFLIQKNGEVTRLDPRSGRRIEATPVAPSQLIAASPKGNRLVTGALESPYELQLFDDDDLSALGKLDGSSVATTCATFSPDGRLLAVGSANGVVVHDVATRTPLRTLSLSGFVPQAIAWSPDQARILVGDGGKQARILRWDSKPYKELLGHEGYVYVTAWSPDGSLVASGGWDQRILIWDALTQELVAEIPYDLKYVNMLCFSEDGTCLYAALPQEQDNPAWEGSSLPRNSRQPFLAWDIATGRPTTPAPVDRLPGQRPRPKPQPDGPSLDWSWLPNGSRGVTGAGGTVVRVSDDGSLIAERFNEVVQGTITNGVIVRDRATSSRVFRMEGGLRNRAIAISPDNTLLATGGRDGRAYTFAISSGQQPTVLASHRVSSAEAESFAGDVWSLDFSPDGARLLTGGDSSRVVVWDVRDGVEILELPPHQSYLHAVSFSPDGTRILSGSGDGTLRIWDSVSLMERDAQVRYRNKLRARMRPRVEQLMAELGSPERVAAHLRASSEWSDEERSAALRVLLARSNKR